MPFASPGIDVPARTAWLLATARLLSPTTATMPRETFLERIRERGLRADPSRISRWESGQIQPNHAVVTAYEEVIGLPDGALWSAANLLRRYAPGTPLLEPTGPVPAEELDEIFDLVEGREATGGHWLRMTGDLARFERVYLHRTTWNTLCTQLLAELTRSGGPAFLRRYEAACALLAHPQGRGHLSRNLGRFVMHPHIQNVAPVITLLREVADDSAGNLVLRLMNDDNAVRRRGATGVAPALAARGHLPGGWPALLERHTGRELSKGGALSRRTDAIDLITHLPKDGYERVLAGLRDPRTRRRVEMARATMELVPKDLGRAISEGIATVAEAAGPRVSFDPDQMLRRLVREALFHAHRERRHLAGVMVAVSPYAPAVARSVLELTADPDDLVASMSWSFLRRLAHVLDRTEVYELAAAEERPGVQARALVTLGLAVGELPEEGVTRIAAAVTASDQEAQRHAAVFALGMIDHPRLVALAEADPALAARTAWWRSLGPAIHDEDVVGTR